MTNDILTEIKFWAMVAAGQPKCIVLCPPDLESRCKGYVDARGLSARIKVQAHKSLPPDTIFVVHL